MTEPYDPELDPLNEGPDNRKWYIKHRTRLIMAALLVVVVGGIGYCVATTPEEDPPIDPAIQAAAEAMDAEEPAVPHRAQLPTPPPVPIEMAPALQEQYHFYRFTHFLYEYENCFGEERPGRVVEAEVLESISNAVTSLLNAYDADFCIEATSYARHPERGKWLRYWEKRLVVPPPAELAEAEAETP